MARFRKKPVVIDAIQWKPQVMLVQEVLKFMDADNGRMENQGILKIGKRNGELVIQTLEGDMTVSENDYIIKGVKGEYYPCKPDVFQETYELVDDMEESSWNVIVMGAKLIQSTYPPNSLGHMKFQRLIDRYDAGERTQDLWEALETQE